MRSPRPRVKSDIWVKSALLFSGLAFAAFQVSAATQAQSLTRIVSNNLCADQYALALAKPEQIIALSPSAADPSVSYFAERARGYPILRDELETVLTLKPGLVLSSVYSGVASKAFLKRAGIGEVSVQEPASLYEIANEMRRIGRALSADAIAEQHAQSLESELNRTKNAFAGRAITALIYDRGGITQSTSGPISAILGHLGVQNAWRPGQNSSFAALSVEDVIALNPSFIVIQQMAYMSDQGAVLNAHDALSQRFPEEKRINVPLALTVCNGPSVLAALQNVIAQIQQKPR